jgi:glycosyltransferase involved in cell wall biosynthesis
MSARVGSVLDQERPDIFNTHALAGFSVGVWSQATRRRVPIVHTLHDYYLMCPPSAMYRNASNCERICPRCLPFAAYRRRASQAIHAVVGVSRFILDRHMRAGFFKDSASAKVIFNSVPAVQGKAPKSPQSPLVFGFIGRICAEKGIRWLLEVFTANARPGDTLVVAGKGEPGFVEALKARFSSPSVTFIGHVDPAVFYEQVDVVVIPSLWNEAFGRTAIEPLAHSIPVIASMRGGLPEIVEDGVTGILIDPDESGSLARAMNRLSAEPGLAGRLGRNGAQRLPRFSESSVIEAYGSVFADAVRFPERGSASLTSTRSTSVARAKS